MYPGNEEIDQTAFYSGNPSQTIDWSTRKEKRDHDRVLLVALKQLERAHGHINSFCLPAGKWLFEQSMIKEFPGTPIKCVGVEKNKTVNAMAVETSERIMAGGLPESCWLHMLPPAVTLRRALTRELSLPRFRKNERFNLVHLDFMGAWTYDRVQDLHFVMGNDRFLPVGGMLFVTLCLGRNCSPLQSETKEFGRTLPDNRQVAVQDDNHISRLIRGEDLQGDHQLHHLVRGISAQIGYEMAPQHDKVLEPHQVRIYYNPSTGDGVHRHAEGSFGFTRVR